MSIAKTAKNNYPTITWDHSHSQYQKSCIYTLSHTIIPNSLFIT